MAALEKIRKRAVVLTIVIGLGLLAFILEEAVSASRSFMNDNAVAKVGGDKIDVMTFQKREQELSAQQQNSTQKIDQAVRQQQLLEGMISEKLFEQEYEKTAIDVSDTELSEALTGKNPSQIAMQFAQQMGAQSPAQAYDLIFNPAKYGYQEAQVTEIKAAWYKMQQNVVEALKAQKLQLLVAGAMQANDLDRKQLLEDGNTTDFVSFVKKDYSTVADDKYAVSDAEIKEAYNKEKENFRLEEPTRRVHYIAVNVDPSTADKQAAEKVATRAFAALGKGAGLDSVRYMSEVKVDSTISTLDKITDEQLKNFVSGAAVGQVYNRENTRGGLNYFYAKLLKKEVSLDSVNFTFVSVTGDKKLQDSVLAQLNSNKALTEVAKIKGVETQEPIWQQIAQAPDSLKNKVAAGGDNYFVLQQNAQGALIAKANEKKAPKTFYTVGQVSYEAYASQKTIDGLRDKLQDYITKNKTAANFEKNAAKAGYNATEAMLTASTPELGYNPQYGVGMTDTRKAIKWAFDNKKGEVSPIFTDNKDLLVVIAIDEAYEGDYLPADFPEIKQYLTNKVRSSKKGDDLVKQFQGKASDINGYAKLFGSKVDTTQVVFAQQGAMNIDYADGGIIGRIAAAKQGQVSKVWKGNNAVYVFQVTKQEKAKRTPGKDELDMQFARTRGYQIVANGQAISRILSQATKVKRNLVSFY